MKNKYKILLLLALLLFFLSDALLFAQSGSIDDTDTLEDQENLAGLFDDWISLILILGLQLGYYILKTRKKISE